jgi:hypothetical protein
MVAAPEVHSPARVGPGEWLGSRLDEMAIEDESPFWHWRLAQSAKAPFVKNEKPRVAQGRW